MKLQMTIFKREIFEERLLSWSPHPTLPPHLNSNQPLVKVQNNGEHTKNPPKDLVKSQGELDEVSFKI